MEYVRRSEGSESSLDLSILQDGPQVLAPIRPPEACPIGWQPSALAPVFHGVNTLGTADGAPVSLRLFFPSLDADVANARVLHGCGRFPVVVFLHGFCVQHPSEHYKLWRELPRQLAKSGYVVLVPDVPGLGDSTPGESHPAFSMTRLLLDWIRNDWSHRSVVMPGAANAVLGHSRGGLHAGQFAAASTDVAAFASLNSGWEHEFGLAFANVLSARDFPKLFVAGAQDAQSLLSTDLWESLPIDKHRVVFESVDHWDYLPAGPPPCGRQSPCPHFPAAAFDMITMFLAKYLPPEFATDLPDRVPDSLVPPPLALTAEQHVYTSASWLSAIHTMAGDEACTFSSEWLTTDTREVPFVRFLPKAVADQLVRARDLEPRFKGSTATDAWVFTQSPPPGKRVSVGDEVRIRLRDGPVP